jgi:NitT/TauT family transport system substrate-binding protein
VAVLAAATALTGCGGDDATEAAAGQKAATLRLGYFPNVTHATAIVGTEKGMFAKALGSTPLKTSTFNAGPAAMERSTRAPSTRPTSAPAPPPTAT